MRNKLLLFLASSLILGAATASLAADTAPAKDAKTKDARISGNDCLFFSTIYDWQVLDDHNLVVWAPSKRTAYQVYISIPLPDMRTANSLAFVDGNHDDRLCGFGMDAVIAGEGAFKQKSTINAMKRLNDAEIAQLEQQYKIKLTPKKKQKPQEPARETAK